MIDNLLWRYNKKGERDNTLKNVAALLAGAIVTTDNNSGEVLAISGYWRGLEIEISEKHGFLLCKGSLAKYYFGNNIATHTRTTAKDAIKSIGKGLGIAPTDMLIRTIEIGANVATKKQPKAYTKRLLSAKDFGRVPYNEQEDTLYLIGNKGKPRRHKIALVVYDKGKESRATQQTPDLLQGVNILRYEMRIKSRLGQMIGKGNPTARDIVCVAGWRKMVNCWLAYYAEINKQTNYTDNYMKGKTTPNEIADAYKMGIAAMIDADKFAEYHRLQIDIINRKYKEGEITRKNRNRAIAEIEQWADALKADNDGLLQEIETAFISIAEHQKE